MTDDGYEGPAELLSDDRRIAVTVRLAGRFEPITGRYRWYGRVAASPELTAFLDGAARDIVLRTPHGEVASRLSDVDPWGRPRVEGVGRPPFPVGTDPDVAAG
jgi:hypothetical protein